MILEKREKRLLKALYAQYDPLLYLVTREDDQLKGLRVSVRCLLGVMLDPHGRNSELVVADDLSSDLVC
jgi:hypothetical protein